MRATPEDKVTNYYSSYAHINRLLIAAEICNLISRVPVCKPIWTDDKLCNTLQYRPSLVGQRTGKLSYLVDLSSEQVGEEERGDCSQCY